MTKTGLSEDAAHRLIARAIELDARRTEEVSIAQLREVAEEAGISPQAFEQALNEVALVAAPKPSLRARLRAWIRGDADILSTRSVLDRVAVNVVAFGAFWALAGVLMRASQSVTTTWVVPTGAMLLANVVGVVVARRLNARATSLILSVTAIAQASEFVLHLIYGIKSVQGGPTHWAVMLASLIGVGAGLFASRRRLPRTVTVANEETPAEIRDAMESRRAILRLRPA